MSGICTSTAALSDPNKKLEKAEKPKIEKRGSMTEKSSTLANIRNELLKGEKSGAIPTRSKEIITRMVSKCMSSFFALYLFLLFFSVSAVAVPSILCVHLNIKPDSLWRLAEGCFQSGAQFHFLVRENDDEQYEGLLSIGFSRNSVSFINLPVHTFAHGVSCNSNSDTDFGLFSTKPNEVEQGFNQYVIVRSFWRQLTLNAVKYNKHAEAITAQSLFQSDSDVEVLLLFDLDRLGVADRASCEEYIAEYCQKSGWKYKIITDRQQKHVLRLTIPLGGEDTDNNNYQSLLLDHKVSLIIEKSGVRKKNTSGKKSMMLFPATVRRSEETNISKEFFNIRDHQEDYSVLLMLSPVASQSTSLWFFPRQSTQWILSEDHPPFPGQISLDEIQAQSQQLLQAPLMMGSTLFMAIKGCLWGTDDQALDRVQHYLQELGYEVYNMPSDNYCGWHAIVHWIKTNRPDLISQISGTTEALTASTVFNFFRERARQMVEDKDSPAIISTISEMMNASHSQASWLDSLQLNYLIAPFIDQSILLFDTEPGSSVSDLPFQVNLLQPGADSSQLSSSHMLESAINEHPNSIMLLHNTNHWLLITHNETYESTAEADSSHSATAVMASEHYYQVPVEAFGGIIEMVMDKIGSM